MRMQSLYCFLMSRYCWRNGVTSAIVCYTLRDYERGMNIYSNKRQGGLPTAESEEPMSEYVVGVDLGGTRMRAALLDHNLALVDRKEVLTRAEQGHEKTLARMQDLVRTILPTDPEAHVAGIGISAPGPSNPNTGVLVAPPNLPGWHNVALVEIMQKAFGHSTFLGNDANVAALA